jgi:hypothetical protein
LRKTAVLALAVFMSVSMLNCSKKTATTSGSVEAAYNEMYGKGDGEKIDISALIKKLSGSEISPPKEKIKKAEYSIDPGYKKEKLSFKSLAYTGPKAGKLAVVGKDGVKLYRDIKAKDVVAEIPIGTVIPLLKEIKNDNKADDCPDVFVFDKERNYWYETEFKGRKGVVFGSFLVLGADYDPYESSYTSVAVVNDELGVKHGDSDVEKFVKLGYYYTKPVKSDTFVDFNGRMNISRESQASLVKNRIALEKVGYGEYEKFMGIGYGTSGPDDMVALYGMMHNDRTAATFISTDLFVHSLHLIFDRMLQDTESKRLLPVLRVLTRVYYDKLNELSKDGKKTGKTYQETVAQMKKFFLIAGDLLNVQLAPRSSYPADVSAEISLITSASGFSDSPLFRYREDYSQFKPRGHYTKSEELKRYFRAMMWFGRLHFYCVSRHPDRKIIENSIKLTGASLLLTKIAKENTDILAAWRALSVPIGYIVGESDDYTIDQFISISDDVDFDRFDRWIEDGKNIQTFIKKANEKLKPPAISGNTLMQNRVFSRNSAVTPAGFRFMGQRFTIDSFVHQVLSSPRLFGRSMVKGLDVMGAFGSRPADRLLKKEMKQYPGYKANYDEVRKAINKYDDYGWEKTFYNSYLKIVREISCFDSSMPFYFTLNDAWDRKTLLTAHASWAELRHDTILYVKQSYSEMAGPGPCKTFSVEKFKRPIGYIEPNLGALYWMQYILKAGAGVLSDNGFMSEEYSTKFKAFAKLIDDAVDIAECEAADRKISDSQNEFIYSIPYVLSNIVMPTGGNIVDREELKMALIADVHTDSQNGQVLEVGTGIPYRMHVALNDGQGGRRIATGYVFSYYEFAQPMSNRLNDDEWKKKVYSGDAKTDDLTPDWAKDILP